MLGYLILFSFLNYCVNASSIVSSQEVSNGGRTKSIPAVDALISRLEQERWKPDDEACLQATLDMLRGVKNNTLWATWGAFMKIIQKTKISSNGEVSQLILPPAWDSMQPPAGSFYGSRYHLGNYDQCLQAPWSSADRGHPSLRTQFCIVDVKSEVVEETKQLNAYDRADEYYRTPTKQGRYFNELFFAVCLPAICRPQSVAIISRHMHQLTHLPEGDVYVDPRDCQKAGETVEYSMGFFVFWAVVGTLFLTAVFSTLCNNDNTKDTYLDTIKKAFCMKQNYSSLFLVNQDGIKVMHGMRVVMAAIVVLVHEGVFTALLFPIVNGLDMDRILTTRPWGPMLIHLDLVVDTFFTMSGLLIIRSLMLGRQRNVLYTLVKRYIRIMGPVALCTMYLTTSAVMHMGNGPLWMRANRFETDVCEEHWWRNLLLVNNDFATLCHVVTWYVSSDFQLAILGTILFCLFRGNRRLGVAAFVAVAVTVTLNLGLTVYQRKLDILHFSFKSLFLLRSYTPLNYTYFNTGSRTGQYLVGMAMGYVFTTYKPNNYRNVISKKRSLVITIVSLTTMVVVLLIGNLDGLRPYNALEAAVVVATNRVFWAIAVCCIIGVSEYGSMPLMTGLLSSPVFVPLSKLSFGIYLLHPFILQTQKFSARSASTFSIYSSLINGIGVIVASCIASLIMYLILEAPFINISNAVFTEKSKSFEQNIKKKAANGNDSRLHQNEHNRHIEPNRHAKAKIS